MDDVARRLREALAESYDLRDEIGRGGMATVYAALDRKHGREVALKVMDPALATGLGAARFLREVRIAAGLTHPGIVPVFDSGEVDGTFFYVMPLLRGQSLRDRMRRGSVPTREACVLLADVSEALDAAHRAGIVHRDVKPENILLADDRALVTDFGVAHAARTWFGESLTETGATIGTVLYMAPEQLSGEAGVDGRADVFSVGAILFEMLTGKPPFAAPTLHASLARLANERAPSLPPGVTATPAVRDIIARALAREPEARFPTAHDLAGALRSAAAGEPIGTTAGAQPGRPARRRRQVVLAGVGCGLMVLVLAFAVARWRGTGAIPSLAVLSLGNASDDPRLEYFSEGIAEELQRALADVPGLRVVSRTSATAWKGRAADSRDIARALGVGGLLEGTVKRTRDSVRLFIRLVDGRTGEQRWTQIYDRRLADVFDVQEEIARAVVRELRVALAGGGTAPLVRSRTLNLEAHDLVLRASFESRDRRRDGLLRALALVDSAIRIDSTYAVAWATRATLLSSMAIFRDAPSPDELLHARISAQRAAALDSLSADAQVALGSLLFRYDWRWADAERHIRRAIALNPAFVRAHTELSRVLRSLGRFAEAREELIAAERLDPALAEQGLARGRIDYFARDYDGAIRETLAAPQDSTARFYQVWLAQAYIGAGRFADAEALLQGPLRTDPGDATTRAYLSAVTGRAAKARAVLDEAANASANTPLLAAEVYVALGDRKRALDDLERAVAEHDPLIVDLKVKPWLDPIRNEPRFKAIMQRLAFPP
jgi:TolB-like protein/tetratricopeptide (TPR) repeat protein/tRNA A-37 threonylcarbamoyl transferase component Bud32